MSKPTKDQIEFARGMSRRQWDTLFALSQCGPFVLSAAERGDSELYALIRQKLATTFLIELGKVEVFGWRAAQAGAAVFALRVAGKL